MLQVKIFLNDSTKNKELLNRTKQIIRRRVLNGIEANAPTTFLLSRAIVTFLTLVKQIFDGSIFFGTAGAKSNALRAVIQHSQTIMVSAVAELKYPISNKSPSQILVTHIEKLLPNETYTYEDHMIAVAFACTALNESRLSFGDKTNILDKIKKEYSAYKPNALERVHHYYHQTDVLKKIWNDTVNGHYLDPKNEQGPWVPPIPAEIVVKVLGRIIPLEYFAATMPLDQLLEIVTKLDIDLEPQYKALRKMRDKAAWYGVRQIEGPKYFDKQYGKDPKKQILAFIREFGKTPLEVLNDPNIEKAFVNEAFIDAWDRIAWLDQRTTQLSLCGKSSSGIRLPGIILYRLPRNIGQLTALERLDLSSNQITSFPKEIEQLINLKELDFSSNQITSLPPEIGNLTALTTLNLCYNYLTSLPPEIGKLESLITLSLYYNKLTSLPPKIGDLTKLKILDLSCNQITSLPPEIGNLTALTTFSLYYNKLTSLLLEIGKLESLTTLNLSFNKLTLPDGIFRTCQKLDYIKLSQSVDTSKAGIDRKKVRIIKI